MITVSMDTLGIRQTFIRPSICSGDLLFSLALYATDFSYSIVYRFYKIVAEETYSVRCKSCIRLASPRVPLFLLVRL